MVIGVAEVTLNSTWSAVSPERRMEVWKAGLLAVMLNTTVWAAVRLPALMVRVPAVVRLTLLTVNT